MTGTCTPVGANARLAIKQQSGDVDWSSGGIQLRIIAETLTVRNSWIAAPELTGNNWIDYQTMRRGPSLVVGSIYLSLRPAEMTTLAPLIVGGTGVLGGGGYTYSMTDDLPYFGVIVDRVTDIWEYRDLKVNRAIVRGQSSGMGDSPDPIQLQLDVLGVTGVDGQSWHANISKPTGATVKPYIFEESVLTLFGDSRRKTTFVLAIDNVLAPQFNDGLTPSAICRAGTRRIMLRSTHPFATTEDEIYGQPEAGDTGSLEFTQAGTTISTLFDFTRVQSTDEDPNARGPGQILLFGDFMVNGDDTNPPMSIFNDTTN